MLSLDAVMGRSWTRNSEEVVAIFLDLKGESCSN